MEARIRHAYEAYSSQDLERLLTFVTADVDWPDGSRRIHGKAAVRAYWTSQWAHSRARDVPEVLAWLSDRVCTVRIDQEVTFIDSTAVNRAGFAHILHLDGPTIARLDIVPLRRSSTPRPR